MPSLLDQCHEVLHDIFCLLYPTDLAAIAQTCKPLGTYLKNNRLLWRDVYLRLLDDPRKKADQADPDWEGQMKRLTRFQKILQCNDRSVKQENMAVVCQTAIDLVEKATEDMFGSLNIEALTKLFASKENAKVFILNSTLFNLANGLHATTDFETAQLSARLHCLYGTNHDRLGRGHNGIAHTYARSRVYDLRTYTDRTRWGPFLNDGTMRVDWEKVESIMLDLAYNLKLFSDRTNGIFPRVWDTPFEGAVPGSYVDSDDWFDEPDSGSSTIDIIGQPEPPLDAMDPYGITGMWRRIVCFLDYNDFYSFNFSDNLPTHIPRDPIDTQEAIRLITMMVRVTKLEAPGPDDGKDLPVVHFKGTSRSMHTHWDPNANSLLQGTVRLSPEGQVRWTTLSLFHGEARWRSEGVQLGGIRSARGVIGTWFEKDYDAYGPAGPTAMWKVTDRLVDESPSQDLPDLFQ